MLPQRYEMTIQIVLNNNKLDNLTTKPVREATIAAWETSKNKGKEPSAQKISAFKRKKGDQSFQQQQHGEKGWKEGRVEKDS